MRSFVSQDFNIGSLAQLYSLKLFEENIDKNAYMIDRNKIIQQLQSRAITILNILKASELYKMNLVSVAKITAFVLKRSLKSKTDLSTNSIYKSIKSLTPKNLNFKMFQVKYNTTKNQGSVQL